MSSLPQQLFYYFHQYQERRLHNCADMCAYCNRRDNCSICCSGEFQFATIAVSSHFSSESTLAKVLKNIKVPKASQFIPISVISFRGAVLVDLLKHVFSFLHTDRQKSRSLSSLTPQEGDLSPPPPPPTASLFHSLLYLSHNPLIKVQIKESLCSSLWPSFTP